MNRTHTPNNRREAGFTLAETLVSGVLGAMLLTAVAYASFEFAYGVKYLEDKAGINTDQDSAMRQLMRDIREAWWAEMVDPTHIKLADPAGFLTEYYLEGNELKLRRPNGDVGTMAWGVDTLVFDPSYITRYREGVVSEAYGDWYERDLVGFHTNLEVESGDTLSMAFVVPYHEEDLPGGAATDEHLSMAQLDEIEVPIAFVPGSLPESLEIEIYKARGPGSASPHGAALASLSIDGTSLPEAVWDDDDWADVDTDFAIDVSALGLELVPGDSYALLMRPTGDAALLFEGHPDIVTSDDDEIAYQDSTGSNWVVLPMSVPLELEGDYVLSNTTVHEVISAFSVTLHIANRPVQTRSAALLSQALSDDPWFGVVPGELGP